MDSPSAIKQSPMEQKIELQLNIVGECGSESWHAAEICFQGNKNVRWQDVSQLVREKLSILQPLAFSYFDDEGDIIFGQSEEEWQDVEALISNRNGRGETTMDVNILVLGNSKPVLPISSKQDCCKTDCTPSCCDFSRPLPPELDISGSVPGKTVNPLLSQYKYSNEALRAVALPIGPIGGGSIALAGDGGLRQWQVSNRVAHTAHVPDSFFAVRVDQGNTSKAVILQSNTWYNQEGFKPAAYVTDHVVPKASIELLSELPGVKTLEVTAKYPIAEVDVLSDEVPVTVHLEMFNPCVPLDSKNSAIPVLVMNYTVTNYSTSNVAKVSLLGSLQNIAGWDGITPITSEVCCAGYGGNLNNLVHSSGLFGIRMNNPSLEGKAALNGQVSITVVSKPGDNLTAMLQYDCVKEMWGYFTGTGLPGQGKPGPSPAGKTWNGAISCIREIPPKCSETFSFLLAWHFPHRYVNWSQRQFGIYDVNSSFYLGNQYAKFWKDVEEVVTYTAANLDTLSKKTRLFRDSMFNSSLSWQLIDSAAGRVSVMRSPTCMWLADGNLYGFEGCRESAGCCPLNCTHVFNYEMAIAKCFPDLERTMRNIDLKEQISPNSIIPSRTTVPLELRRQWSFWPNYTDVNPSSTQICVDGEIGTVLKTYREVLQGAPEDWFQSVWPAVKKIMNRWMTELDNGDGLVVGPQPNTYDCDLYGVNTFIGGLYLAALRASEEMAKLQKETDLAAVYAKRFALGSTNLDKACFTNGKWYTQVVDPKHPVFEVADGTWVDCLLGQWWAHALHLGYILPPEHVKSTLQCVHAMNHVDSFNPADQFPRKFFDQRDAGMFICRWPGTPPKQPLRYTSEGAWSGLEYPFAGLCLYENLVDIAQSVLKEAREKYDGTRRSPWNEIECGDHYVRPMAAFLLFEIASGQTWRLSEPGNRSLSLEFAPRVSRSNFCAFFITGTAWGQLKQRGDSQMKNGTAELCVHHGELLLSKMILQSRASIVKACVAGENRRSLVTTVCKKAEKLEIHFDDPSCGLELKAGESLVVNLSG